MVEEELLMRKSLNEIFKKKLKMFYVDRNIKKIF